MKYTIEEYVFNDYNASSKARKDVSKFILDNGFISLFKNDKTKLKNNKLGKLLLVIKLYCRLLLLTKNDILFLQSSLIVLRPILLVKAIRKFKIIYLIHDVFSLRYNTPQSIKYNRREIDRDIALLSKCNYVIAHNTIMAERLRAFGCNTHISTLRIFDYNCSLTPPKRTLKIGEPVKVVFAGNLNKSLFLKSIDQSSHQYQLFVYGMPEMTFQNSIYKGCVDADVLPNVIEGHFGLIWEGDSIQSTEDNYICINNPHKLSMYIVAGLPVITWEGSAAARFVEENNIGFVVSSLDEIDKRISEITSEDYSEMIKNCNTIRERLNKGYYLKETIKGLNLK